MKFTKQSNKRMSKFFNNLTDEEFNNLIEETDSEEYPILGRDSGYGEDYSCTVRGYVDKNNVVHVKNIKFL